jgi:hypothetical protein
VPQRSWPAGQNPWQSYEACRVQPGTGIITRGPYNLGLLYFSKAVPNPKVFYCPSLEKYGNRGYAYYSAKPNVWPSTPPAGVEGSDVADDNVRSGYNYYPQPKEPGTCVRLPIAHLRIGAIVCWTGEILPRQSSPPLHA